MASIKRERKARATLAERRLAERNAFFPGLDKSHLWDRTRMDGFTTIPRTIPLICRVLDSFSTGQPLSATYVDLWCMVFDESYVKIDNPSTRAYCSGFSGERAVSTWKKRIKILDELGFIRTQAGSLDEFNYIVIYNPHIVIQEIRQRGKPPIIDRDYIALQQRAFEVGAKDFTEF